MRPDGTPDMSNVLAEETYPALKRYKEIKSNFGFSGRAGMTYSNFGGVSIPADIPHFLIYQNVNPNPRENFVSLNSPVVTRPLRAERPQHARQERAGAIAGLDPREAVAWSADGGVSWGWGRQVGGGPVPGDYPDAPATTACGCPGTHGRSRAARPSSPTSLTTRTPRVAATHFE